MSITKSIRYFVEKYFLPKKYNEIANKLNKIIFIKKLRNISFQIKIFAIAIKKLYKNPNHQVPNAHNSKLLNK